MSEQQPVLRRSAGGLATRVLLGVVALASVAPTVYALEDIVVTARKRGENLQDVPMSISAFDAERIDRLRINNLEDLSRYDPSITFTTGISPQVTRPVIRGLQTEVGRSNLAILFDGIDATSENVEQPGAGLLFNTRLVDIERIEVVKGPQSALYGRSAFGGAVNYITRRPGDELRGKLLVDVAQYDEYEVQGGLSGPVVDGRLNAGINAFYYTRDGKYTSNNGGVVGGSEEYGAAGSLLFTPTDTLSIYGRLEITDGEYTPLASGYNPPNDVVFFSPEAAAIVGFPAISQIRGTLRDTDTTLLQDPFTGSDFPGSTSETTRFSIVADWDLGSVELTSLTGFVENDASQNVDQVQVAPPAPSGSYFSFYQLPAYETNTKQFSQELRIASSDSARLNWMLGALYWTEDLSNVNRNAVRFAFPLDGLIPLSTVAAELNNTVGSIDPRLFSRDTDHLSFFGLIEYDVTDSLTASFELRYVDEEIKYNLSGQTFVYGPVDPVSLPGEVILFTPNTTDRTTVNADWWTPKATLRYAFTDNKSVYLSVGRGIKPEGFNTVAVTDFNADNAFESEELWAYEIGAKTRWLEDTLTLNAALFLNDYTDQQVNTQRISETTGTPAPTIDNAGESEVLGLELEATWQPIESLTLFASYTYLNAEYKSFDLLTDSATTIAEAGGSCTFVVPTTAGDQCNISFSGNQIPFAADHTYIVSGRFDQTTASFGGLDWYAEAILRGSSERFVDQGNNIEIDSFIKVDLRLGLERGPFRAMLYVDNVFDDDTPVNASPFFDGITAGFPRAGLIYRPEPTTAGARLTLNF